ncbi:MAG: hypothetical protein BGO29_08375 [Bacteroidales bacterium 36-12]|nr:MAG: hypothetical protein BGO29_08375 [Bacteroidales bacterium 36-12]
MLADSPLISTSTGVPRFTYSPKLDDIYETSLFGAIPDFIHGLKEYSKTKKLNEEELSQEYFIALSRYLCENPKGILAVSEYKDFYTVGSNPKKRVDIAFISSEQGSSKTKLYTVEAKRLPTGTGQREQEYIYGFNKKTPTGGIQRFKTGDYGFGLSKSALLGYVEEKSFTYWYETINSWIVDKAKKLPAEWKDNEQLQNFDIDLSQNCSVCHSVAHRKSDSIELFHLWIKIT